MCHVRPEHGGSNSQVERKALLVAYQQSKQIFDMLSKAKQKKYLKAHPEFAKQAKLLDEPEEEEKEEEEEEG
jgi:hypothetical protein